MGNQSNLRPAEAIVEGIGDPAILVDPSGCYRGHNGAFAQATGASWRAVARALTSMASPFALLGTMDGSEHAHLERVLQTGLPMHLAEIEVANLHGDRFIVKQSFLPIPDDRGEVVAVIVVFRDVTAEARIQRRYRELLSRERLRATELERCVAERTNQLTAALEEVRWISNHDPLTGLLNRRAFRECAEQAWSMAQRYKRRLGVILCDLDHFKQVNDTYGHQAGDEVLIAVARALTDAVRTTDKVTRYGGEEFLILLTEISADSDAVAIVAQRCAESIRQLPIADLAPGHPGRQTASLGLAVYPEHGQDLDQLIAHADQAMYQAKRQGRDQVVAYTNEELASPSSVGQRQGVVVERRQRELELGASGNPVTEGGFPSCGDRWEAMSSALVDPTG